MVHPGVLLVFEAALVWRYVNCSSDAQYRQISRNRPIINPPCFINRTQQSQLHRKSPLQKQVLLILHSSTHCHLPRLNCRLPLNKAICQIQKGLQTVRRLRKLHHSQQRVHINQLLCTVSLFCTLHCHSVRKPMQNWMEHG